MVAQPKSKTPAGINLTTATILVLLLLAFGISMRLVFLGRWAYHHDESIHAWFSYRLYEHGRFDDAGNPIYRYDPVYHGPFLYHFGALFFCLFGDNDFTGRLPFALFGVLMLILVYQFHRLIGKPRATLALLFAVLSPGLAYFSRFARNDIYMSTATLALVFFGILYLRDRKAVWFYLVAFFLGLMYCTKENSYVSGFILCGFLVLYVALRTLWEAIFDKGGLVTLRKALTDYFELTALVGLYGIFCLTVFLYIKIPIDAQQKLILDAAGTADITRGLAQSMFQEYIKTHDGFPLRMQVFGIGGAIIYLVLIHILRDLVGEKREKEGKTPIPVIEGASGFFRRCITGDLRLLIGLAIIVALYTFLFTTMFSNWHGLIDGATDYVRYWYAQKLKPRIAQAELGAYYYVYFFVIYDLAAFVLAVLGIVYYAVRLVLRVLSNLFEAKLDLPPSEEREPPFVIPVFLSFWALFVLLLYSKLHERVPWLYTHQALPVALLAGYFLGEVYLRLRRWRWAWWPVAVVVGIVAVFSLRANILLNLYRWDDPREVMVYVQSNRAVREMVKEVEEVAYKAGTFENTQIGVSGGGQWPFSWYLRHYRSVPGGRDRRYLINIADPKDHGQLQVVFGDEFEFRKYRFRDHWSPNYDEKVLGKRFSRLWWKNHLRYFFYRAPWSDVGGAELMFYRKRQLREVARSVECPAGFDRPPRPGALVQSWGRLGSGEGEFRNPRGLAISPDGFLYVCDSQNFRVQKFTLDGKFVLVFGGPSMGSEPQDGKFTTRLSGPGGVVCDSKGFVYVTDTWGHRIQKFDAEGQFVRAWNAGPAGNFFGPRDVAVDAQDRIYVVDTGNKRILVYDSNGNYLNLQIGRDGSAPGEFVEPVGIEVAGQEELFVADVGNKRIQVLTLTGRPVRQWNLCGWETEVIHAVEPYLAAAPDGTVYTTDSTRNCVYQFPPDGRSVVSWGVPGSGSGQLLRPTGIAVDREGFIYVSDMDNHRINKYRKL